MLFAFPCRVICAGFRSGTNLDLTQCYVVGEIKYGGRKSVELVIEKVQASERTVFL